MLVLINFQLPFYLIFKDTFSSFNWLFSQDIVMLENFYAIPKSIHEVFDLLSHLVFENTLFFLAIMEEQAALV